MRPALSYEDTATASIANGASLSSAVDLGTMRLVGVGVAASTEGTVLTFQTSADGTTYANMYDSANNEVSITFTASVNMHLTTAMLDLFSGVRWLKVRTGTAGTPSAQTGANAVNLILGR